MCEGICVCGHVCASVCVCVRVRVCKCLNVCAIACVYERTGSDVRGTGPASDNSDHVCAGGGKGDKGAGAGPGGKDKSPAKGPAKGGRR